jgi:hypothetical protein
MAANAEGKFRDMMDTAIKRKALLNSLSGCSANLKKHVGKKNILTRNKIPLCATEIRKLVDAAGLNYSGKACVEVVPPARE